MRKLMFTVEYKKGKAWEKGETQDNDDSLATAISSPSNDVIIFQRDFNKGARTT